MYMSSNLMALAIVPGLLLIIYVYKKDRVEKEPPALLIKLLLFGIISCIAAGYLEQLESQFLPAYPQGSVEYALQTSFLLNPTKISGTCGRLMCCLNFEDKTYKELRKGMPKDNERVETPEGLAKVVNVDYFNGKINTRAIDRDPETGEEVFAQEIRSYTKDEIKRIGKSKDRSDEVPLEVMFDDVDAEEIRELEELMKEF